MPLLILLLAIAQASPTWAQVPLPYTTRTHDYTGWSTTIRGDIRTIGMSGAMVGLADTFIASGENPAGLAMTMDGVAAQISGNDIKDLNIQSYDEHIKSTNLGAAASIYPWGLSLGYWSPQREGQTYHYPNLGPGLADDAMTDISVREFRIGLAHILFDNHLSIGGSLTLGQVDESIEFHQLQSLNQTSHSYAIGGSLGALYKFRNRVLLGLTYHFPMHYTINPQTNPTPGVNQLFQSVQTPPRLGLGLGWIPNRHFRYGVTLLLIGPTQNTALLSDDQRLIGQNWVTQPRVGASYVLAEYSDFKAEITAGSYYEFSRIQGYSGRLHGTAGLELNPWVFNVGWGIDESVKYHNFIFAIGVDFIRLFRKLDLIPPPRSVAHDGLLPRPFKYSDEGLSRPLAKVYTAHAETPSDIFEIGKEIPKKLEKKIESIGNSVKEFISPDTKQETPEIKPSPLPAPKPKLKRTGTPKKLRT